MPLPLHLHLLYPLSSPLLLLSSQDTPRIQFSVVKASLCLLLLVVFNFNVGVKCETLKKSVVVQNGGGGSESKHSSSSSLSSSKPPNDYRLEEILVQVDKLQRLEYGQLCDSVKEEQARHDLTNLVAQVIQTPSTLDTLYPQIEEKRQEVLESGKHLCDYTGRGLACSEELRKCTCYDGHRHEDLLWEPVREGGNCKLDEMSRCYSPSYLVSRGAVVIHCINGAKCVGDLSGRRCTLPLMSENCHCQKPCPDGSFTNLMDELRKCIAKLNEISILQWNETCFPTDQEERDEIVRVLETSGSERAGPIIRGIKHLLASNRSLCSPQDQLVCHPDSKVCVCGPEKDGFLYGRENDTCVWAKGSRCFPEEIYANITGSNGGTCVMGTYCLISGVNEPCNPNFEEPQCYCQSPEELEATSLVILVAVALVVLIGAGGGLGFLVYAKILPNPFGGRPANV